MPGLLPPFLRGDVEPHWLYVRWVRGVPWARTIDRFKSYSIYVTVITMVIVVGGGITAYNSGAEEATAIIILGVAGFAFIIVDFASVLFGIATAREHISKFDLLRMSPLPPELLTKTLYQVAQTRSWRVLVVMQAIRFSVIVISVIFSYRLGGLIVFLLAGIVFVFALWEPVWRIQLTTAIGVMAGVAVDGVTSQWGMGFGLLMLLWVAQGIVGLIPFAMIFLPGFDGTGVNVFFFWVWFAGTPPLMAWGIRYAQRRICHYCLARTSRHILEPAS
ncbi:MAG: hypothetical protein AAF653_18760 [Chloroflexota bacterium]